MCNKKDRIIFESILHSDHFVLIFDIDLKSTTLTNWIVLRKIKLRKLVLQTDFDEQFIFEIKFFDLKKASNKHRTFWNGI